MRHNAFLMLIIATAFLAITLQVTGCGHARRHSDSKGGEEDFSEKDEVNQSYKLSPGARVEVSRIDGPVEIETADIETAEVHVIRSARNKEDLEHRKVSIEGTPTSLIIRGDKDEMKGIFSIFGPHIRVRQHVMLRLPRKIALETSGINGTVAVGEIEGAFEASGINGAVKVAQAGESAEFSGINGRVEVNIKNLGSKGIDLSGINGPVDLWFADDLNADLNVSGIHGSVIADLPNVTMEDKKERNNYRARIGEGGASISVSGINGNVKLAKATSKG